METTMGKLRNFTIPDLAELYSQTYDERMTRWRARCAVDKSRNIVKMTADVANPIPSILEVGCGTGAVLQELAASGIGSSLTGIEIGSTRSQDKQSSIGGVTIRIRGYDGVKIPYADASLDLGNA